MIIKILNFITRIADMGAANGKRRIGYALTNTVMLIITAGIVYLGFWLFGNQGDIISGAASSGTGAGGWLAGAFTGFWTALLVIVGGVVLGVTGLMCFLHGVIGQVALMIITLIGAIVHKEERKYNIAAFVIAFLSVAGSIAAVALLIIYL